MGVVFGSGSTVGVVLISGSSVGGSLSVCGRGSSTGLGGSFPNRSSSSSKIYQNTNKVLF